MSGSWLPEEFPRLTDADHNITSAATRDYNCLAWAANEIHRRWDPDSMNLHHWPPGVQREVTLEAFVAAYNTLGYEVCNSPAVEVGVQKLALYVDADGSPTHAARQLPNGAWTSKIGDHEDIEHFTLECLNDGIYGRPALYMRKTVQGQ